MTSSIVVIYCSMFLISIPYFLLRFPAKICPLTRKNKLVIVIRTTKEKDVKFVSNARLFLNLILLLPHGGANIYHIQSFVLLSAAAKRGWNSKQPAYSCKSILDSGDSKGDGKYWIDPENSGNPLNVYCDMTTDGGEICSKTTDKSIINKMTKNSVGFSYLRKQVSKCGKIFPHEFTCQILTNRTKIGSRAWPTHDYGEKC